MKKIIISLSLALIMLISMSLTALADAPTVETWECFSARNGAVTAGYDINVTNLQVSSFYINNNSQDDIHLYIVRLGSVIFEMHSLAYSGYQWQAINNFKFQRIPLDDPDDPNSVRYPPNTTIYCGTGGLPN